MANGYQIIVTPRAEQKLEDIVFYVKENASEETAEKVRKGILEAIKSLAKMPTAHPLVPEISTEQVVFRRIMKWSYRIIYTIKENELTVVVVEINHEKEDLEKLKGVIL